MNIPPVASAAEEAFALHLRAAGIVAEREYRFAYPRRWRADFAVPAAKLLIEIEGGIWSGGRHTRGAGYSADCEKYNAATLAGWSVLRFPSAAVRSGMAINAVQEYLSTRLSRESSGA